MEYVMSGEIPGKDLFMMCEKPNTAAFRELPSQFHFRLCRRDELEIWKQMLFDFELTPEQRSEYMQMMTDYFNKYYAAQADLFFAKCLFACNADDMPVGRCFIWKSYGKLNTIQWYKVLKSYENQGIGRALLTAVMKDLTEEDYPVYLHTHPSSFRAMKLYSDFGFALLSDPVIGFRNNDLDECMPILEKYMPEKDFKNLRVVKAPQFLLDVAASTSEMDF